MRVKVYSHAHQLCTRGPLLGFGSDTDCRAASAKGRHCTATLKSSMLMAVAMPRSSCAAHAAPSQSTCLWHAGAPAVA